MEEMRLLGNTAGEEARLVSLHVLLATAPKIAQIDLQTEAQFNNPMHPPYRCPSTAFNPYQGLLSIHIKANHHSPMRLPPVWKAWSGMSCNVVPGMADCTGNRLAAAAAAGSNCLVRALLMSSTRALSGTFT